MASKRSDGRESKAERRSMAPMTATAIASTIRVAVWRREVAMTTGSMSWVTLSPEGGSVREAFSTRHPSWASRSLGWESQDPALNYTIDVIGHLLSRSQRC